MLCVSWNSLSQREHLIVFGRVKSIAPTHGKWVLNPATFVKNLPHSEHGFLKYPFQSRRLYRSLAGGSSPSVARRLSSVLISFFDGMVCSNGVDPVGFGRTG